MDIYVDRKALANFRRRALRRYPNEFLATIWGLSNKSGGISIVEFRDIEHEATTHEVTFSEEDTQIGERDGRLTLLGTIHTHPDLAYCEPSEEDWHDSGSRGELIMGIMAIPQREAGKRPHRSRVQFYFARALCNTLVK